jgi:hypothetical protein
MTDYYSKYLKYKTKYLDLQDEIYGGVRNLSFETERIAIGIVPNEQDTFLKLAQVFQSDFDKEKKFHITLFDILLNKQHPKYKNVSDALNNIPPLDYKFISREDADIFKLLDTFELLNTFLVKNYELKSSNDLISNFTQNIEVSIMKSLGESRCSRYIKVIDNFYFYIVDEEPLFGYPDYLVDKVNSNDIVLKDIHPHISIIKIIDNVLTKLRPNTEGKAEVKVNRHMIPDIKKYLESFSKKLEVTKENENMLKNRFDVVIRLDIIGPKFIPLGGNLPNLPNLIDNTNSRIMRL